MDLVHALAAGSLAARTTVRRHRSVAVEVREAERRVLARREAMVAASTTREYTERGRHVAPRPATA